MKKSTKTIFLAVLGIGAATLAATMWLSTEKPQSNLVFKPKLAFLKTVVEKGLHQDELALLLLLSEFQNLNKTLEGITFFDKLSASHPNAKPYTRSIYLAAKGLLAAQSAAEASPIGKFFKIQSALKTLSDAVDLGGTEHFFTRFARAVVLSQVPDFVGDHDLAKADLQWLKKNLNRAYHPGFARGVYAALARLADANGEANNAQKYLKKSGYTSHVQASLNFLTNYSVSENAGFTFFSKLIETVVPERVFRITGVEFTDFYFVISNDGTELIAIDAGTSYQGAKAAFELLSAQIQDLPPLTTVLVTHAHWDHIGGHRFFTEVNPNIEFIARANFASEIEKGKIVQPPFPYFFGQNFNMDDILSFKATTTVAAEQTLTIGGSTFEIYPVTGGETDDALVFFLKEEQVLFTGDIVMPYIGAPFVEEGSPSGLTEVIAFIENLQPKYICHGHDAINKYFGSLKVLKPLKMQISQLQQFTIDSITAGASRQEIHQSNFISDVLYDHPETLMAYLAMRENLINRVYDNYTGYWHKNLEGLDTLSMKEIGHIFKDYLDTDEGNIISALEAMLEDGNHGLAAKLIAFTRDKYSSQNYRNAVQRVFLKLAEQNQNYDPFKFIIYSNLAKQELEQISATVALEKMGGGR